MRRDASPQHPWSVSKDASNAGRTVADAADRILHTRRAVTVLHGRCRLVNRALPADGPCADTRLRPLRIRVAWVVMTHE